MTDEPPNNTPPSARDMDDESLFDRIFPDGLREWVRDLFTDEADQEPPEDD